MSWATMGGPGLNGLAGSPFIARSPTSARPSSSSTLTEPAVWPGVWMILPLIFFELSACVKMDILNKAPG